MWGGVSRSLWPKQVDGKPGQADAVHPVLQAVLVQLPQWRTRLAGERLHPAEALMALLDRSGEDRPGPLHRRLKGPLQPRRVVGASIAFSPPNTREARPRLCPCARSSR